MKHLNTIITGTGSYIPEVVVKNSDFVQQTFFEKDSTRIDSPGETIVSKFRDITGIYERRWTKPEQKSSDLATIAARKAIEDAGIDAETIDYIIVAHNFGDILAGTIQTDLLPCLASRVKHNLGIIKPSCVAYDVIFGCPGWVLALIQADSFIKSGLAKRCLIIGTENLSRVVDKYDRDTMIFSDGAGAAIVEGVEEDYKRGVLSSAMQSDTVNEAYYLYWGKSNFPDSNPDIRYLKMDGRKIYEYSLSKVPLAIKAAVDKSGIDISEIKKIFLHQANEKMDEAIVKRFFKLYKHSGDVNSIMPMNIYELGNSSVATVPTLYDMVLKGKMEGHTVNNDDIVVFASVGSGMHINAVVYKH